MKNISLPQYINLIRLSEHDALFSGSLLIKDMQRLLPSLYDNKGEVVVNLELQTDEEGTRFCHLKLQGRLNLQCQRCMEPYNYEIISDFLQGLVGTEKEAQELSTQYEPFIVKDGVLIVQDMVEDELILKLPLVPRHSDKECEIKLPLKDSTWDEEGSEKENPFKVLRALKPETK